MKGDGEISGFGSFGGVFGADAGAVVDFAKAHKLERSGSTCEVYETTLQRRRVFVKRLKPEFRNNPQYRAAFDKEFDLGVSLTHPSLPRYVALHDDYIVMDYVEGETLAELLKRGDVRLRNRKWVRGVLRQLVDVIDYLHHSNVVHCDVKADNVIVSPYADRPVTLVDLDKAYTSWLDGTPGNPHNYGCDDCADGVIDFRGLGKIAEKLGEKRFAKACLDKDASADRLRDIIKLAKPASSDGSNDIVIGFVCFFVGVGLILLIYFIGSKDSTKPEMQQHEPAPTTEMTIEPVVDVASEENDGLRKPVHSDAPKEKSESLDEIVRRHYGPLYKRHEFLKSLMADSTTTVAMLRYAYTSYAEAQMAAQESIMADIMEKYALPNALDASSILGSSKQWGMFMEADSKINDLIGEAIDKRNATQ